MQILCIGLKWRELDNPILFQYVAFYVNQLRMTCIKSVLFSFKTLTLSNIILITMDFFWVKMYFMYNHANIFLFKKAVHINLVRDISRQYEAYIHEPTVTSRISFPLQIKIKKLLR